MTSRTFILDSGPHGSSIIRSFRTAGIRVPGDAGDDSWIPGHDLYVSIRANIHSSDADGASSGISTHASRFPAPQERANVAESRLNTTIPRPYEIRARPT